MLLYDSTSAASSQFIDKDVELGAFVAIFIVERTLRHGTGSVLF